MFGRSIAPRGMQFPSLPAVQQGAGGAIPPAMLPQFMHQQQGAANGFLGQMSPLALLALLGQYSGGTPFGMVPGFDPTAGLRTPAGLMSTGRVGAGLLGRI